MNIFSKVLTVSPVNYLIAYRLKKAAHLFKNTEDKIDFIAQVFGFDSAAYFCRKFKNHFGVTPGMYRKNIFQINFFYFSGRPPPLRYTTLRVAVFRARSSRSVHRNKLLLHLPSAALHVADASKKLHT